LENIIKKLYIIRHAKSDKSDDTLKDFDRPLNKRGLKNSPFMGSLLKNKNINPDLILSSPALRALTTAEIIANRVEYKKEIETNKSIYTDSYSTLEKIIHEIDDNNNTVFFIGHNPGVSALINHLCQTNLDIPTCAVVEIAFDTNSWEKISKKNSTLISYEYPKKYT
jgi:phosphohistidine phosphatase